MLVGRGLSTFPVRVFDVAPTFRDGDRRCALCLRDPAAGFASVTQAGQEMPLCHPDVEGERDCYSEFTRGGDKIWTTRWLP